MTVQNVKLDRIDHVVLTVKNILETKKFYSKILGKPKSSDKYQIVYKIGKTKLFLVLPYGKVPQNDRFNPNRVGLEHLAFGVSSLGTLKQLAANLDRNKIKHSGIHVDKHSDKEKIWLNDPDEIRLEFFL